MAKNDFQYGRWNVAQSWHWFCQVTAPCNVACGSGIMTVNSPIGSTLQCDTWLWDDMPLNSTGGSTMNVTYSSGIITFARWQHPAMWKGGSGMTCHGIRWNVCHIGILHLVSISTHHRSRFIILYQSGKFYPNRTTLSTKKMTSCRFSR